MQLPDQRGRRRTIVLAYVLAWMAVGLFLFSRDLLRRRYAGDLIPWTTLLSGWTIGICIAAALGPAVLWLGHRFPIEPRVWGRRILLHLGAAALFATIVLGVEAAIDAYTQAIPSGITFATRFSRLMVYGFHGDFVIYWLIVGLQSGFGYYQRFRAREQEAVELALKASALETALVRSQLHVLKVQLRPHFLFNTLNAAMVQVRRGDRPAAEDTLAKLSDLLRLSLADADAQEVPLSRELEHLQLYIDIQQIRFQDRLRVELDVDPALADAAVPAMGLQPIVENAIRHAVEDRSAPGLIRIAVSRAGDRLVCRISDNGPGFGATTREGAGLGLANTRARLRQLHGDAAALDCTNADSGGAVVTMVVPFHTFPLHVS